MATFANRLRAGRRPYHGGYHLLTLLAVCAALIDVLAASTCDAILTEAECESKTGCPDCPCKWRSMGSGRNWCRACGIDCAQQEEAPPEGLDMLKTALIIVGVCIGVCLLGGVGYWHFFMRKKSTSTLPTTAPAAVATTVGVASAAPVAAYPPAAKPPPVPNPVPVLSGSVALPLGWTTSSGVTIIPEPERCAAVQQLMGDTWKVKYTRDRKKVGGESSVPGGCRVVNVLRVENHGTWNAYANYREQVRARRSSSAAPPFQVLTSGQTLNDLDKNINEMYLFHGTSPKAAHKIASDDFRIRFAGTSAGTMFGPGIYLAENSSKSDEYAKEGDEVYVGLYAMLICRAVAGKVYTVQKPGDYSDAVKSQEYDSVCGDRLAAVGTFREMIFFNEASVYTEYIAIYARTNGDE